jgi:hypothetical protein
LYNNLNTALYIFSQCCNFRLYYFILLCTSLLPQIKSKFLLLEIKGINVQQPAAQKACYTAYNAIQVTKSSCVFTLYLIQQHCYRFCISVLLSECSLPLYV